MDVRKKMVAFILVAGITLSGISAGADTNMYYNKGLIEGYLKNVIGEQTLEIEAYDGRIHFFAIEPNALFNIDEIQVPLSAFKPGMEIRATLVKDKGVTYIKGHSTANKGYLAPGSKVRNGIVVKIEYGQIWLRLETGEIKPYIPSSYTTVLKNGRRVNLGSLYEGDRVKLFFDNHNSTQISRVEIQGDYTEVKEVYKGRLAVSRNFGNGLTLENVQVLRNGKWENHQSVMSVPSPGENKIFTLGRQLPKQQLGFFQGSEVYLVVKDYFGQEQVEKVIIKEQFETAFIDKIESINLYTGSLQLVRNDKLNLHNDTIIINNRRLVDRHSIFSSADAFVVANGRGNDKLARLVYIYNTDLNNSDFGRNQFYFGKLDIISEEEVWLEDFFLLTDNSWQYQHELEKGLYYNSDTYIFDTTEGSQVDPAEFPVRNYAVDEDSYYAWDNDLKDWYGYIFTNGDRIISISVMPYPQDWNQQRVANGIVQAVNINQDTGYGRVTLREITEWSNLRKQWMVKSGEMELSLAGTLLLKDELEIKPTELKAGDRVFFVRDNINAKLVLVK